MNIYNKDDLEAFRDRVNRGAAYEGKTINLMADIDLQNMNWTPIGTEYNNRFKGKFEGNNHKLSNVLIERAGDIAGIFGCTENSTIQNLVVDHISTLSSNGMYVSSLVGLSYGDNILQNIHITNASIQAGNGINTGILIAMLYNSPSQSFIENCTVQGKITKNITDGSNSQTGLLMGASYICKNLIVRNCRVEGEMTVTGNGNNWGNGGLIGLSGENETALIEKCSVKVNLDGRGQTGGLIGAIYTQTGEYVSNATIQDCYVEGHVKTNYTNQTGGLIAAMHSTESGKKQTIKMNRCYVKTTMETSSPNYSIGSFIGYQLGNVVIATTECYWDKTLNSRSNSIGTPVGKTTQEMQNASTFATRPTQIWDVQNGKYPTLK